MAINLIISPIIKTTVASSHAKDNSLQRKKLIFTIFLWSYNYHLYHILSHKSCPEFCWGKRQPMRWLPALQDLAIYSPTPDDHYHKGVSHSPLVSLFLIMMMLYSPYTKLCKWWSVNGRRRCISAPPMLEICEYSAITAYYRNISFSEYNFVQ